ncbi:hypothetical protein [Allorhizocola rhizosphaerae]|uniref:hypothetical protein n=1 Tax=Allorhizocola rhizosphaerae TaxID=1872709 RepID=UPI000E3D4238|nr:hypothetical protein [Allorhizocola rhizosphaerae]
MGHWSEDLAEDLAQQVGGDPDREEMRRVLLQASQQIETLSGRNYDPVQQLTSVFATNGLPFVETPNMHLGSLESSEKMVWQVRDPVNPVFAAVLQVMPLEAPSRGAVPVARGLGLAGQLVAQASRRGLLSREFVIRWLGAFADVEERKDLFRRLMDPSVRFYVPIFGAEVAGWWIQVSRRLLWVTQETPNDGRLVEPLIDEPVDGHLIPLVATEPVLIAVPMTRHPAEWAFSARIWVENVPRSPNQLWNKLAPAIHGSGIPTITIDRNSTPYEVACQVVLKAYWHGYISGDEPGLVDVIALAYPKQVNLIQRKTRAPHRAAAAAALLEQLIQPGFDPAQGAEATRRYVRRKASIIVMEHRKQEAPQRYPWTQIGISERRYYKLLPLLAEKVNGRYNISDYDDIVARMKTHLNEKDQSREVRAAALELLQTRGFTQAAARKWLQRHRPEEALHAWPRGTRPDPN